MLMAASPPTAEALFNQFKNWSRPGVLNGTDYITMMLKDLQAGCGTWIRMIRATECGDADSDASTSFKPNPEYAEDTKNNATYCVYDYRNLPWLDQQCPKTCWVSVAVTGVSRVGITDSKSCSTFSSKVGGSVHMVYAFMLHTLHNAYSGEAAQDMTRIVCGQARAMS